MSSNARFTVAYIYIRHTKATSVHHYHVFFSLHSGGEGKGGGAVKSVVDMIEHGSVED